jgi:hypothetical protein
MGECTAGHAWQQVNLTMVRFEQFFLFYIWLNLIWFKTVWHSLFGLI